jgi:hypothetical protein
MEGKGQDGTVTLSMEQQIGGVHQQELLATALREDNTPVATISTHTNMKVVQSVESAAGSSAGVGAAHVPNVFLIRDHFGAYICVCSRSSTIHSKVISRSSISAGRAKYRTAVKGQTR